MKTQTIIRLQRQAIFDDRIGFHLAHRLEDGRIAVAAPLTMNVREPSDCVPSDLPVFSCDPTEAQHLMDELWNLGIRPTEGHGSTGQLAAVESHLAHTSALLAQVLPTVLNQANAHTLGYLPPTVRLPTAPASGS